VNVSGSLQNNSEGAFGKGISSVHAGLSFSGLVTRILTGIFFHQPERLKATSHNVDRFLTDGLFLLPEIEQ
jgi:hypothetical protein